MRQKMSDTEIAAALPKLQAWTVQAGKLHREYKFAGFKQAMEFMQSAVEPIDKMDHHPEWFNVYNKVIVDLNTHDAGGITAMDFKLAELLDELSKRAL